MNIETKYKRLIQALRYANSLTLTEAEGLILARKNRQAYHSEACNHAGGVVKCLQYAIKLRRKARLYGPRSFTNVDNRRVIK